MLISWTILLERRLRKKIRGVLGEVMVDGEDTGRVCGDG